MKNYKIFRYIQHFLYIYWIEQIVIFQYPKHLIKFLQKYFPLFPVTLKNFQYLGIFLSTKFRGYVNTRSKCLQYSHQICKTRATCTMHMLHWKKNPSNWAGLRTINWNSLIKVMSLLNGFGRNYSNKNVYLSTWTFKYPNM